MQRLRYPTGFNPTIPDSTEKPLGSFFSFVRQFLGSPPSRRRSTKHCFNEGLTKAIHKDIDATKSCFKAFRMELWHVERAFESLDEANKFFDRFDEFAEDYLKKNFKCDEFQEYVKTVTHWVNSYVKMKAHYNTFLGPLTWHKPGVEGIVNPKEITVPPEEEKVHISLHAKADHKMTLQVIANFRLTTTIYQHLIDDFLKPQSDQFVEWLQGSKCLHEFLLEYETLHAELIVRIEERIAHYLETIASLEEMTVTNTYKDSILKNEAERSMKAVTAAFKNIDEGVKIEHRTMIVVLLNVYNHALQVLKGLKEISNPAFLTHVFSRRKAERKKAAHAAKDWITYLERVRLMRTVPVPIPFVVKHLPQLYAQIAHFSFKYCSPH